MFIGNKIIYADNAASSFPKPKNVINETIKMIKDNASNPGRSGHKLSLQAAEKIYTVRHDVGEYLSCDDNGIIFTQNATHAINILLKGILNNGDHVLISDMEHNSVLRPLVEMKDLGIISFDIVPTNGDWISDFKGKIKQNTKLIMCTNASNVTGRIFDIEKLAKLAHDNNILFATDASQTSGYCDINMKKAKIDFLCTSGHKGLLGPQGSGVLAVNCNVKIRPLTTGGTGSDSLNFRQPYILPEALEAGTLATPSIVGLGEGIKFLRKYEADNRIKECQLAQIVRDSLHDIKRITVYSDNYKCVPTIAFNINGLNSEEVAYELDKENICVRGGFHCSALAHRALNTTNIGAVRLSFGPFNTLRQAEKIIQCINKLSFF